MLESKLWCDPYNFAFMNKDAVNGNTATKVKLERAKRQNGKPTKPKQKDFPSTHNGGCKGPKDK